MIPLISDTLRRKSNFVINDIELYVPPTAISIHKENLEYSFKTLRNKVSTKVASGNGTIHIQIDLLFSYQHLLELHRLICQINNIPLVYIQNDFIVKSLGIEDFEEKSHFTVFSFAVSNHPSSAGSMLCQLDLRFFNNKPYTNKIRYHFQNPFQNMIFNPNFNEEKYIELPKQRTPNHSVQSPKESLEYIRYSNYLQTKSLLENFGFNITKNDSISDIELDFNARALKMPKQAYDAIINATAYASAYKMHMPHAYKSNYTSFKRAYNAIMLESMLLTSLHSRHFIKSNYTAEQNRELRKILNDGITNTMSLAEKQNLRYSNYKQFINGQLKVKQKNAKQKEAEIKQKLENLGFKIEKIKQLYSIVCPANISIIKLSEENSYTTINVNIRIDNNLLHNLFTIKVNKLNNTIKNFNLLKEGSILLFKSFDDIKFPTSEDKQEKDPTQLKAQIFKRIQDLEEGRYFAYLEIPNVNDIYRRVDTLPFRNYDSDSLNIKRLTGFDVATPTEKPTDVDAVISSVNGAIRHIVSSIPIIGQPYPTHQFLGSIEPIYAFNFIASKGSQEIENLENIVYRASYMPRKFMVVPDAGNVLVESFITKLFGSFKQTSLELVQTPTEIRLSSKMNFSINSSETFTIEGSPNSFGMNIRFSESNSYDMETLSQVSTTENNVSNYLEETVDILKNSKSIFKPYKYVRKKPPTSKYDAWQIGQYTDLSYFKNNQGAAPSKEHNINAYFICELLHNFETWLKSQDIKDIDGNVRTDIEDIKVHLVDVYSKGRSKNRNTFISNHYLASAVDIKIEKMTVLEGAFFLLNYIQYHYQDSIVDYANSNYSYSMTPANQRTDTNKIGLGLYGKNITQQLNVYDDVSLETKPYVLIHEDYHMSEKNRNNGFIHIDLNLLGQNTNHDESNYKPIGFKSTKRRWIGKDDHVKFIFPGQTDLNSSTEFWTSYYTNISNSLTSIYNKNNSNQNDTDLDSLEEESTNTNAPQKVALNRSQTDLQEVEFKVTKVPLTKQEFKKILSQQYNFNNNQLNDLYIEYYTINTVEFNKNPTVPSIPLSATDFIYNKITQQSKPHISTFSIKLPAGIQKVEPLKIEFENYPSKSMANLALKNKELLEAFQQLASSILIEPSLYLDKQEIEQELIFIKKELYGLDIVPFHFNIVNKLMGEEAVNIWASEKVSRLAANFLVAGAATGGAASYGAGLIAGGLAVGFVPAIGQLLLLLASVAGALYAVYDLINTASNFFQTDNNDIRSFIMKSFFDSFNKNQKDYFEVLETIYRDYQDQQKSNQDTISDYKENSRSFFDKDAYQSGIQDFYENINESHTLQQAISVFIETIFPSFPAFEKYRQLVTGMKISNNLRSSIVEKKKDKYELIGLSEEITGSALREYLTYIFAIESKDELELDEIFTLQKDANEKITNLNISNNNASFKPNTFLNKFDKNKGSFKLDLPSRLKSIFKESQKIRVVFLKDMLKRILDEFIDLNKDQLLDKYSNKTIANAIDNRSIFQLLETNAYPDVILPPDPKLSTFNSNLHPVFFIVDNNEFVLKDKNLRNLTKSYEMQDPNKILNNSIEFMEAMRDPKKIIFSGTYEDFIRTRDFNEKFDKNREIILDTHEINANTKYDSDPITGYSKPEDRELVYKHNLTNLLPDAFSNLSDQKAIQNITEDLTAQVEQLKNLEDVFGSKYGYLNKKYFTKDGKQKEDNSIEIKTLTRDAVKNITSLKTMKHAFPTFRFYLVEEDQIYSDRFTAFDDFFSFNSVISFDYYTDKSMPAATAHIRLQNVSGILDGTKKDTLRDIDYSANSRESSIETLRKNDQLVDSVVLRPGISVQLRAGFDSNTNNLDILLSGKIIEINYANNNTICNLTLQSFGFELEAKRKGVQSKSTEGDRFGSTHQLLSAMLLSPELKHFGRVKTGAEFQTFETREPALDVKNYLVTDTFNFAYTRSVFDYIGDNYFAVTIGLLAAPTLVRKVGGAAVKKIGDLLSKVKNPSVTTSLENVKQFTSTALANSKNFANRIVDHTFTGGGRIDHLKNFLYNFISIPLKGIRLSYNSVTNIFYNTRGGVTQAAINVLSPTNRILRRSQSLNNLQQFRLELKKIPSLKNAPTKRLDARLTNILGYKRAAQLGIDVNALPFSQYEGILKQIGEGAFKFIGNAALEPLALAGTLSIVPLILDVYSEGASLLGALFTSYQRQKRRLTTRILLSPQDDNVFPPHPSSYLTDEVNHSSFWDRLLFNNVKALYQKIFSEKDQNILQTKELFYDKRLSTSPELLENEYILSGQTTWKVLKDMCLRHPGWVCGLRPYGNSLEYRVFFGVPSQRHFSKQIKYSDLKFLKDMEEIIFKDPDKVEDKAAVLKDNINSKNLDQLVGEFKGYLNKHYKDLTSPQEQKAKVNQLIDLYLSKTEDRFTPYRKYHYITSENDIIANNIILSSHNVVNSVDVHFKKYSEDNTGFNSSIETLTMNSLKYVTKENRKPIVVNEPNVIGIRAAYRYGLATLLEGAKNMYEGSLLILGNTKINTHDIVVLRDEINNMFGVLEVKSVTHMFSHERGFITELGVNAVTTANEGVTYPQLYELFKYLARRKLYMQYSNYASFKENEDAAREALISEIKGEIDYLEDENPNIDDEIDEEILKDIVDSIFEQIDVNKTNDVPSFIEDITSNFGNSKFSPAVLGIPESQLEQYLNLIATGLITTGATSSLVAKVETSVLKNMGVQLFSKVSPKIANFLIFGGMSLAALKSFPIEGLNESYRSGMFGKQYFQSAVFATVEGQNLVQIYPLMRGGVPLLAGGYEHVSNKQIWNNVYGNIYNNMSNSLEGYFERQKELSALGELAYYNYMKDDEDFSIVFRFQKAASDLFGGDSSDTQYNVLGYFMED